MGIRDTFDTIVTSGTQQRFWKGRGGKASTTSRYWTGCRQRLALVVSSIVRGRLQLGDHWVFSMWKSWQAAVACPSSECPNDVLFQPIHCLPVIRSMPMHPSEILQTAKVFMRPREEINDGLVQRSWSAYHPYSLIWNYSFFGSVHDLAAASRITIFLQIPLLPWHKFIPPIFLSAWHKFLKVIFNFKSTFREKDNAIFAVLPLFHNPRVRLPFRHYSPGSGRYLRHFTQFCPCQKFSLPEKVNLSFSQLLVTHFTQH